MPDPALHMNTVPRTDHAVAFTPVLDHLSGVHSGARLPISGQILRIGSAPESEIHFPIDREPKVAWHQATLTRSENTYVLSTEPGRIVLINGKRVTSRRLLSGDLIRLEQGGPVLRYRIYPGDAKSFKSIPEALTDCNEKARLESKTKLGHIWRFTKAMPPELMLRTSVLSRILVLATLIGLIASVGWLGLHTASLERRLGDQTLQANGLRQEYAQNTSSLDALSEIRKQLERRVDELENRSHTGEQIVGGASRSVVFIQGSYGFLEPLSRDTLHLLLDPAGDIRTDSKGNPFVTTLRSGPIMERMFTGSGFVAGPNGSILTNRHIALPWEFDKTARALIDQGYIPYMRRFLGYLPKSNTALPLKMVIASKAADVAILRARHLPADVQPLPLSSAPAQPGEEVYVLGYPTGMRALIARSSKAFVDSLMTGSASDFWHIARRLADGGHIAPLATRGIIGQVTDARIVYDAETTSGGSGGPVIGLDGRVRAINSAIMVDFAGSNLGVPAREAQMLLHRASEGTTAQNR